MRHRLLKSLRIAVTATSLLVCALLIVLWVRSYSYAEHVSYRVASSRHLAFQSGDGFFGIVLYLNLKDTGRYDRVETSSNRYQPSWYLHFADDIKGVSAPYWFYLTIFATIAALPWIKWQFSLRTLLIAMTLFALFFGAIAMSL